jgi:hypothetical protein
MKTDLNDQVQEEYHEYLRTKAMVDYYKPLLLDIARRNKDIKHWTVTFGNSQRVLFMFYGHQDEQPKLSDFVKLREIVVNELSYPAGEPIKLETKISNLFGEGHEFISATGQLPPINWKHGTFQPGVEIRMFGVDKCEIEYVEKTVKEPVLTGFCAEVVK